MTDSGVPVLLGIEGLRLGHMRPEEIDTMSVPSRPKTIPKRSLASLRRRLLRRRSTLMEKIQRRMRKLQRSRNGHIADSADMASTEFGDGVAFAFTEAESRELAEVNEALDRVDSGEYGCCEGCGDLVGLERLKALPFARLCLGCKQREESAGADVRAVPSARPRELRAVEGLWNDDDRGAVMSAPGIEIYGASAETS